MRVWQVACLIILLSDHASSQEGSPSEAAVLNFHPVIGYECINKEFVRTTKNVDSAASCAETCNSVKDCQAFSFSFVNRTCRMFVFNRCSKNVRQCRCDNFDQIFVRKQPGLNPGALCPADFGHNRCGIKYKYISDTTRWDSGMARCSAEAGLSIMAEPIDLDKLNYVIWLFRNRFQRPGDRNNTYLGGSQDPGSPEPAGGWVWSTCRIPVASDLWVPGQPDHADEHWIGIWDYAPDKYLLNDFRNEDPIIQGAVCECASPFE